MSITPQMAALAELAKEGGRIAQSLRDGGLARELKSDGSIVTAGDRKVEEFLRKELVDLVPSSTIWGEEFGHEKEGEAGLWVVDPVDGTSNYSYGSPLWGVTAALVKGPDILLGAIYLPDLGELFVAGHGEGAYRNGEPIKPIPSGAIRPEELVSFDDGLIRKAEGKKIPGKLRCSGSFVIDGAFTATQRFRGLIGHRERLYDIGTAVLLGQELGADIRYADGLPFELEPLKEPHKISKPWIIFPKDSGFYL